MSRPGEASPVRLLGSVRALDDTIVAPATARGAAAIAIVRISGLADGVGAVVAALLGRPLASLPPRRLVRASIRDPHGETIDSALVVRFPRGASYTGDELVELHLHGSDAIVVAVLDAAVRVGARLAGPGEFTLRAVRAGRMSLPEAEGVDALVRAETADAARLAARLVGGELHERLKPFREVLLRLQSSLEAAVDFSEEIDAAEVADDLFAARSLAETLDTLLAAADASRRLLDGARVVLTGPVNAGKSTLFNALLGHARAIVAAEPGTTRDVLAEPCSIAGHPLRLHDTAGLREASGVEGEGIARARAAADAADLVVYVVDARTLSTPTSPPGLGVATHGDLLDEGARARLSAAGWLLFGAPSQDGLDAVRRAIATSLAVPEAALLHTARQIAAASGARDALRAAAALPDGEWVLLARSARAAREALDELLGEQPGDEVLDAVFARFCVGK